MKKLLIIILSIFELIFYTFFMVLIDDITIENMALKQVIHFSSLIIIGTILYFIIRTILNLLKYKNKETIYMVSIWNIVLGIFFPILLIIILPNEGVQVFSIMLLVSTFYYGILINIVICILNSKVKKKKQ